MSSSKGFFRVKWNAVSVAVTLTIIIFSQSILFYLLGFFHVHLSRALLMPYAFLLSIIYLVPFILLIYFTCKDWKKMSDRGRFLWLIFFLALVLGILYFGAVGIMYGRGFGDRFAYDTDIDVLQKLILSEDIKKGQFRKVSRLEWKDHIKPMYAECIMLHKGEWGNVASFTRLPLDAFEVIIGPEDMPPPFADDNICIHTIRPGAYLLQKEE